MRAWWLNVTVTPDERRTVVFNKGTWNGLIASKPNGGQHIPISKFGASLMWKKAQKKEKKNKISEIINKAIPQRNPFTTRLV